MAIEVIEPNGSHFLWDLIGEIKTAYGNLGKIVIQTYNQALSEGFTPEGAKNFILRNSGLSKASVYRTIPREAINPNLGRPSNFSIEKVEQGASGSSSCNESSLNLVDLENEQGNKVWVEPGRIFKPMGTGEYEALKESIRRFGQIYPIILNKEGVILDGRWRDRVCRELGVTPKTEVKEFEDKREELVFIINMKLRRKTLGVLDRVELGLIEHQFYDEYIPDLKNPSKEVCKKLSRKLWIGPTKIRKCLNIINYFRTTKREEWVIERKYSTMTTPTPFLFFFHT